jgi:hypothetical protein
MSKSDAQAFAKAHGPYDIALCLEVAEHLPAWHGDKLLDVLMCGRTIIFSAAHPNQGGTRHVNERAASHWIEKIAARGYRLSPLDDALRSDVAALKLAPWYAQNIHAFDKLES